jgi:hypothetical protein
MNRKNALRIVVGIVSAAAAFGVGHWPEHAAYIQMTFYSVLILGLLVSGLWRDRHHPRFWIGILLTVIFHFIFLFLIRSMFPFRTVLAIVPVLVMEGIFGFTFMHSQLGYGRSPW